MLNNIKIIIYFVFLIFNLHFKVNAHIYKNHFLITSIKKNKNRNKQTNYFPFKIFDRNGRFIIKAEIEGYELHSKYDHIFKKYNYSGNGYCWEGHISQILEKINPQLLKHIEFDPEAGAFFAYADSKSNQIKFVEILSPIFSNLHKLEEYIKKADHGRIDD